jgi:hypothetical protein
MVSSVKVFGQDPTILAELMLEQEGGDPGAVRGLAELCRQAGAIREARDLYARVTELEPDDERAQIMITVLDGSGAPAPPSDGSYRPTPFVRLFDFLPPDLHAEVLSMTRDALPKFEAAQINSGYAKGVDRSRRSSLVLAEVKAYRQRFQKRLAATIDEHDVPARLGVDRARLKRYDLQVTCHGDGDHFTAHTDVGAEGDPKRVVSFVYYFHTEPRAFSGGGLRLFDAAMETKRYRPDAFTRIEPVNNSIVFFPSTAPHEVERVDVPSRSLFDGRFSINGWINEV